MGDAHIIIKLKENSGIYQDDLGKFLIKCFSIANLKYTSRQGTLLEFDYFEHDDEEEFLRALIEMLEFRKDKDIETLDIDGLRGFICYLKPSEQRKLRRLLKPKK